MRYVFTLEKVRVGNRAIRRARWWRAAATPVTADRPSLARWSSLDAPALDGPGGVPGIGAAEQRRRPPESQYGEQDRDGGDGDDPARRVEEDGGQVGQEH